MPCWKFPSPAWPVPTLHMGTYKLIIFRALWHLQYHFTVYKGSWDGDLKLYVKDRCIHKFWPKHLIWPWSSNKEKHHAWSTFTWHWKWKIKCGSQVIVCKHNEQPESKARILAVNLPTITSVSLSWDLLGLLLAYKNQICLHLYFIS